MTQRGPIGNGFRRNAAMRRPRGGFAALLTSNSKRAAREFFLRGDSRINGNMIHAGDGDFGVAFVGA
jgi:hypothetical protein